MHRAVVILSVLVWSLLPTLAGAEEEESSLDTYFPEEPLLPSAAEALLTPALLGPPAAMCDARTRTAEGVDPLVLAVEERMFGKHYERLAAPDALRRYAAVMHELMRAGRPMDSQQLFVAEHVGLSDVPFSGGWFITGDEDPEGIADLAGPLIKTRLKDDQVRGIALVLDRDEDEGATVGTLWVLRGEIDFEPFPRRWEPGQQASIPGLQLSKTKEYALWVSFGGTEVKEFPILGAEGRFDIEVPLPEEPGIYRVAMSVQKKRRMPDSPFFFSLYVGVDLPTAFASPLQVDSDDVPTVDEFEDQVVALINDARGTFGLDPLAGVSQRERIRQIVAEAPVKSAARYRYFVRRLSEDPFPEEPHGLWYPTFTSGTLAADAAWLALEHPISRSALLDPEVQSLAFGASPRGEEHTILLVAMEPAPDAASVADAAFEMLSARSSGGLQNADLLEVELDNIAAKIAAGKMPFGKYFGPIRQLHKKTDLLGGAINANALAVPPGGEADLADFEMPKGAKFLAIGDAVGDLGKKGGIQYTVLIVVAATKAQ